MKRFIYYLEYLFLRLLVLFANLLPYSWAVAFGKWAGFLLFRVLSHRRKITLDNLRIAFPDKSNDELLQIGKRAFQNIGQVGFEFISIPRLIKKGFIKISNTHHVWDSLKKGRGVILIVSHLTNWEVMAIAAGIEKFPIRAIGRPLKNPFVYHYVKHMRGFTGLKSINKSGAIKEVVKLLKQNQVICFLIDQHERQGALPSQFFGRLCYTTSVPARLAAKWNVPVVATFCYRDESGALTTDFEAPFKLINTGDEEKDAESNTQLFVSAIEKRVREMPGNWLWMHRRWRPKPDED